jgi:hypothetical protein
MNTVAFLAHKNVGNLRACFVSFTPMTYADKLLHMFKVDSPDDITKSAWVNLGKEMAPQLKRVASFHPLYGTFETGEVEAKKRAVRKPKVQDVAAKAVQPEKLSSVEKSQTDMTEEEVQKVLKVLNKVYRARKEKPIGYLEFVVDPFSFGSTVENIFHVSFLVKDNLAKIALSSDGLPTIEPTRGGMGGTDSGAELQQKQHIVNITIADWKKIKDEFQIKSAMIPK